MQKVVENLTDKDIDKLHSWLQNERLFKTKAEDIKILAPIERPLHDILCVGVNYSAHLQETQDRVDGFKKETNDAVYFGKRAIKILGSGEKVQACFDIDSAVDYEVELAVIIGKTGKTYERKRRKTIFSATAYSMISPRAACRKAYAVVQGKIAGYVQCNGAGHSAQIGTAFPGGS